MGKKALTTEEIISRCEKVGLTYVSHYTDDKKQTRIIAKCQCGEQLEASLGNIPRYIKENKTYSCKECGRKKSSEAQKGDKNHMYGKKGELHHSYGIPMSQEQKNKSSTTVKEKYKNGYINPMKGKQLSEETRKHMSENHADVNGEKNPVYGKGYLFAGEKNPNWRHDLTDEDRQYRKYKTGYKAWIKNVKQKANYTCNCCGYIGYEKDGVMVGHHLNDYHTHKELATDINNGVCLCKHCHKEFHSYMGGCRVACTEQDYLDFKQTKQEQLNSENDTNSNVA